MTRAIVLGVLLASAAARAGVVHGHHGGSGGGVHVRDHRHPDPAPPRATSSSSTAVVLDEPVVVASGAEPQPACVETTDVVGMRECKPFGTWSRVRVPVFLDLGLQGRQYGGIAPGRSRATALASAMRLGFALGRHAYAGVEGELGGAVANGEMGASTRGTYVAGYGVLGLSAGASRATLAAELAAGVRDISDDSSDSMTVNTPSGVVEARVRGEVWLTPWVSAGATVGSSLIDRGDWMAGFYLGVHSRAFGG